MTPKHVSNIVSIVLSVSKSSFAIERIVGQKIDIDIPQASILKAAAKSGVKVDEVGSSQLDFKFVVTGDNDKSVDCTHRDFDFDVSVTGYIVE